MEYLGLKDTDYSKDGSENKDVRAILDFASSSFHSRNLRRQRIEKLYQSYNGFIDESEIQSIAKLTGRKSKVKYIRYRLGRTKMKQLHGEFLEIPLRAQVHTTNREAINRKMQKYKQLLGLSFAKPYIDTAREMGFNVFQGVKIPDKNEKNLWSANNFKLMNEMIMQYILEKKLNDFKTKSILYQNFIDLTIAAETFGKVEIDANGSTQIRFIPANLFLYEENVGDFLLENSPYLGEVRPMFIHEILTNPEFDLTPEQKRQLKEMAKNSGGDSENPSDYTMVNNVPAINVYTIQWKGLEPVIIKISKPDDSEIPYKTQLSREYYEKNLAKINRDVKNGKYEIKKFYREVVWTSSKIGKDIYLPARRINKIIQTKDKNGKFRAQFDYVGILFGTVNGTRVSLQEVIYELERIYDDIRFIINKEIRKIRGSVLKYDKAFLPKDKYFIDVIHDISEEGVVTYNSSAEGNRAGLETESNKVGIDSINLGDNQTLLALINQAMDIERVMDKITGMNEARQGLEKATTTATTAENNVQASRSMTYDLFFFMGIFIQNILMRYLEKAKLNIEEFTVGSSIFLLTDEQLRFLSKTKDLILDNYVVTITDGRKEQDVLNKIETLFPAEINAGLLRTKDVAKFYMESNFAKAIKILDEAHEELEKIREKEIQLQNEAKNNEVKSNIQIAREDREDRQKHDEDMEVLRTEGKKEVVTLQESLKENAKSQESLIKDSKK